MACNEKRHRQKGDHVRVDEALAAARTEGRCALSFEMFPPKGALTLEEARVLAGKLAELAPDFVSVTCSAGGSGNAGATQDITAMIAREFGVSAVAHLTCMGLTRTALAEKIAAFKAAGIENVMALRGDPVPGADVEDYPFAKDLIPELAAAGFCVGAAAYPEGHIACDDLDEDVRRLKQKQDAGARFLVTQLCFDNEAVLRFLDRARAAGITVPIAVGIMPFMSKQQLSRMVFMCAASLPAPVIKLLAKYEGDPEALRQAGVAYACRQLEDLRAHGVEALHVYTMNRPAVARACAAAVRG